MQPCLLFEGDLPGSVLLMMGIGSVWGVVLLGMVDKVDTWLDTLMGEVLLLIGIMCVGGTYVCW